MNPFSKERRDAIRNESVEEMWLGYAKAVGVPPDSVQWCETKKAFHAGVASVLFVVAALPDDEKVAVGMMEELTSQVKAFAEKMRRGEAP